MPPTLIFRNCRLSLKHWWTRSLRVKGFTYRVCECSILSGRAPGGWKNVYNHRRSLQKPIVLVSWKSSGCLVLDQLRTLVVGLQKEHKPRYNHRSLFRIYALNFTKGRVDCVLINNYIPVWWQNLLKGFYRSHRKDPKEGYYGHSMIYSPHVLFIRDDKGEWQSPVEVEVVTSAGVVHRYLRERESEDESGIYVAMNEWKASRSHTLSVWKAWSESCRPR